jgi:ribosomal protein L18E
LKISFKDMMNDTEFEQFRLECEARYWIKYARQNGLEAWKDVKDRLTKRRGEQSVNRLVSEMNRQKSKT